MFWVRGCANANSLPGFPPAALQALIFQGPLLFLDLLQASGGEGWKCKKKPAPRQNNFSARILTRWEAKIAFGTLPDEFLELLLGSQVQSLTLRTLKVDSQKTSTLLSKLFHSWNHKKNNKHMYRMLCHSNQRQGCIFLLHLRLGNETPRWRDNSQLSCWGLLVPVVEILEFWMFFKFLCARSFGQQLINYGPGDVGSQQ